MKIQAHVFKQEKNKLGYRRNDAKKKRPRSKAKSNLQIIRKINEQSK